MSDFDRESHVSALSVTWRKRSGLWRLAFQIELMLAFVGVVVYAFLASINLRASLWVILIASLTVGNLLVPLQIACRRLCVARPFPWNWIVFFPIQLMFGVICAAAEIVLIDLKMVVLV